jgi:glycerol uptake facilitator-like aquaporin
VAEFVATFALIFIGAGAVIAVSLGLNLTGVALALGLVLAIMVSITWHISGGLVNPAVTIGLWVAGKIPAGRDPIVAQLLGPWRRPAPGFVVPASSTTRRPEGSRRSRRASPPARAS